MNLPACSHVRSSIFFFFFVLFGIPLFIPTLKLIAKAPIQRGKGRIYESFLCTPRFRVQTQQDSSHHEPRLGDVQTGVHVAIILIYIAGVVFQLASYVIDHPTFVCQRHVTSPASSGASQHSLHRGWCLRRLDWASGLQVEHTHMFMTGGRFK